MTQPRDPIIAALTDALRAIAVTTTDTAAGQALVYKTMDTLARAVVITFHTTAIAFGPDALTKTYLEFLCALGRRLRTFDEIQTKWETDQPHCKLAPAKRVELSEVFHGAAESLEQLRLWIIATAAQCDNTGRGRPDDEVAN